MSVDVKEIAGRLRWDLAGELIRARASLFHPDAPLQMVEATASQAIAMYHLGLHVARILTPLGDAVRFHLLATEPTA